MTGPQTPAAGRPLLPGTGGGPHDPGAEREGEHDTPFRLGFHHPARSQHPEEHQ